MKFLVIKFHICIECNKWTRHPRSFFPEIHIVFYLYIQWTYIPQLRLIIQNQISFFGLTNIRLSLNIMHNCLFDFLIFDLLSETNTCYSNDASFLYFVLIAFILFYFNFGFFIYLHFQTF